MINLFTHINQVMETICQLNIKISHMNIAVSQKSVNEKSKITIILYLDPEEKRVKLKVLEILRQNLKDHHGLVITDIHLDSKSIGITPI